MRSFLMLCLVVGAIGCARIDALYNNVTPAEVTNRLELEEKDGHFNGLYYVGSDDRKHYLVIKRTTLPDLRYAVFKDAWKPSTERHFLVPEAEWEKLKGL